MSKLGRPNRHEAEIRPFAGMSRIQPHAAGVDIGAHEIVACVPGSDDTQIVRTFGTYTADLHALADWLKEHHIETVAMESTGIYWIPLFETLEDHGLHCCLDSNQIMTIRALFLFLLRPYSRRRGCSHR